MKIAYLISAHNNPEQLFELCEKIKTDFSDIYIHIDRKSNLSDYLLIFKKNNFDCKVNFIVERVNVKWMGFSQVESTLNLIKAALSSKIDYKYLVFLSGTDYPIKSNDYLFDFFSESSMEYLSFWRLTDRKSWLHKIEYYFPTDIISIRNWKVNYRTNPLSFLFWGCFFKFRKYFKKREFLKGLTPYGGSSWWMLTSSCCKFILEYIDGNNELISFYKYTHAPDEMFFQTIIMNSKFKDNVYKYNHYIEWTKFTNKSKERLDEKECNLRYIDWSGRKNQFPVVLDHDDITKISQSNCLFARKFDCHESRSLINFINKNLL